jgi:hypothetical protein
MPQTAAGLRFTLETREKLRFRGPLGRDHFDCDQARGSEVRGQVDVPHSTCAQVFVDPIFAVKNFAEHECSPAAMITIA